MKYFMQRIRVVSVVAVLALLATPVLAQSSPQFELPKVDEPSVIGIGYNGEGQGRIRAADRQGRVHQFLEVWENKSKAPNVVSYILIGDDRSAYFSATWGRGPVNTDAFNCAAKEVPDFSEKTLWVATVAEGVLTFQEIQDSDIKGLFSNLATVRRDWGMEINSASQRNNANLTQENLLTFMKKKNREKWLQNGWLLPANGCVRHFQ